MKTKLLILSAILLLMLGCKKDEVVTTGELSLSFHNTVYDLNIRIYSMDNENIPIANFALNGYNETTLKMNIGNYYIWPISYNYYFPKVGFQVRANHKTKIHYDEQNNGNIIE